VSAASRNAAPLRFDGQVVIVTGAGGRPGLGRAYCHLLGALGARVVVNDLGSGPDGSGRIKAHAEVVAAEIVAAGGEAISNSGTVATEAGAKAVVAAAVEHWGRLDAVVNNAGVCVLAPFAELTSHDIQLMVDVHLMGTIWMCRAAWPVFAANGYGRLVNITSMALVGNSHTSVYGAAKAGIVSLTHSLAIEGAELGIKANVLAPHAGTIATDSSTFDSPWKQRAMEQNLPELVAPTVAYLAHPDCEPSGLVVQSSGGKLSTLWYAQTAGVVHPSPTVDTVAEDFRQTLDKTGLIVLPDPLTAANSGVERPLPKPYRPVPQPDRQE
jgi:NAD(P)-dependent dehydrogenase (short-subunit alcohol dehydrogenase family)